MSMPNQPHPISPQSTQRHDDIVLSIDMVQLSDLHTGDKDSLKSNRAHAFALDSAQRPIIRGSSLRGVLMQQLEQCLDRTEFQQYFANNPAKPLFRQHPYQFSFARIHAQPDSPLPMLRFRQHNAIDRATGAAKDNHLFSVQTTPVGTVWRFELRFVPRVISDQQHIPVYAYLLNQVLGFWQNSDLCLGGRMREGYGRLRIINIDDHDTLTAVYRDRTDQTYPTLTLQPRLRLRATLSPHAASDKPTYGYQTLAIGGHRFDRYYWQQLQQQDKPMPLEQKRCRGVVKDQIDSIPALRQYQNSEGAWEIRPYIPASALKGVLRSWFERLGSQHIELLFGSPSRAGLLCFYDAVASQDWYSVTMQHHAEDEFAGGTFEGALYDSTSVHATFDIIIEQQAMPLTPQQTEATQQGLQQLYYLIQNLGAAGMLPIGGHNMQGCGWLYWQDVKL